MLKKFILVVSAPIVTPEAFAILLMAHGSFAGCFKLWELQQDPHIDAVSYCFGMYYAHLVLCSPINLDF